MDSTTGTYICPVCKEQVPVGMRCSRCNAGLPPSKTDYAALTEENKRLREDNNILQANNKNLRGEISGYKADFGKTEAQTIADLRAKLQQAEEERDGLKHRLELATNAYLAHKDKDAVELKKALAAQEAELDRYKRAVEPVGLVLKRVAAIIKGTDTEHVVVNYPERPQKGLLELVNETIKAVRSLGEDSPKAERRRAMVKRYDAGLLNDYGGGNVEWWQDYIRAEIDRCNDYWEDEIAALRARLADYKQTFDLIHQAEIRGVEMFREAHPEYAEKLAHPSTDRLVCWLLEQLAAYESRDETWTG